jgi:hypothetical protein
MLVVAVIKLVPICRQPVHSNVLCKMVIMEGEGIYECQTCWKNVRDRTTVESDDDVTLNEQQTSKKGEGSCDLTRAYDNQVRNKDVEVGRNYMDCEFWRPARIHLYVRR